MIFPLKIWQSDNGTAQKDAYGYEKNFRTALPQIIAVSVKNLILLAFGTSLGFPTILLPALQSGDPFELTPDQLSWISSINLICVPIGCAFSGVITTAIGRKRAMQLVNFPFIVSWIILHYSSSISALYAALALSGVAGGLLEAPVLTYVAEITQPHLRGMLSSTSTLCIILGIFTQFLMGILFPWRTVALTNISIPVAAIFALQFIPESPFWLLSKNRFDETKKSLQWFRGWTSVDRVQLEYDDIYELIKKSSNNPNTSLLDSSVTQMWKNICRNLSHYGKRTFWLPFFIVALSFFLCHFGGMTTLQTYSVLIFGTLDAPIDKYYATLILGLVQLLGCLTCVTVIHFTGKRLLVFTSTLGVTVCLGVVGCYAYYLQTRNGKVITELVPQNTSNLTIAAEGEENENNYSWIPLTFLIGSAFVSHIATRLLAWILIGEVYSPETRSTASAMSGGLGYLMGFFSNKSFFNLVARLTLPGTFWLYSGISFVGAIILYFILPETEGHTLNAIAQHFAGQKKLPNKVNRDEILPVSNGGQAA